jgi:hypothetical protein
VAAPDFFVALDLSGSQPADMVRDLLSRILSTAGCGQDACSRLITGIEGAIARGHGTCRVSFHAGNGHLEIAVSASAGELWNVTESLA